MGFIAILRKHGSYQRNPLVATSLSIRFPLKHCVIRILVRRKPSIVRAIAHPVINEPMLHRSHDYRHLSTRWRTVAKAAGLSVQTIANTDGMPVFAIKSPALSSAAGIYLSAGIHGDEPASCAGLLAWAESHLRELRDIPALIFPCLNPWGLTHNRRTDSRELDLNRIFHKTRTATISGIRNAVATHQFRAALMLHEDYDGEGGYLYEHAQTTRFAEPLLTAAEKHIPRDPRTRIDGRRAQNGILRPRITADLVKTFGLPEAVWLYQRGCANSITFETPSEAALEKRVAAHVAVIEKTVELCR